MSVEDAAEQYGLKHKPDLAYIGPGFVLGDAFKAGAAWQKEQAQTILAAIREEARKHERHLMVPPNDRNLDNILLKDVIPWLRALAGGDDGE